jgi:hypothetical protein
VNVELRAINIAIWNIVISVAGLKVSVVMWSVGNRSSIRSAFMFRSDSPALIGGTASPIILRPQMADCNIHYLLGKSHCRPRENPRLWKQVDMRAIQTTFHSLSIYNNIMSESIDDLLRDGTLVTKNLYCLDLPDTNLVPPTPVFGLPSPRCDNSLLISGIQCLFPINKAMEKKCVYTICNHVSIFQND